MEDVVISFQFTIAGWASRGIMTVVTMSDVTRGGQLENMLADAGSTFIELVHCARKCRPIDFIPSVVVPSKSLGSIIFK